MDFIFLKISDFSLNEEKYEQYRAVLISFSSYGYEFDDFNASKFLNENEWKLYGSEFDATKKAMREMILLPEKRKKNS